MSHYAATRDRVETYFDRTATKTWEALTSDVPVSGVRATVRAGRDDMRALMLAQLPHDLRGMRILDAGCGPGAMTVELAKRGADEIVAADISPALIDIGKKRLPKEYTRQVTWVCGDMLEATKGRFDAIVAMDSLIYYTADDIARTLAAASSRADQVIFTLAPRTPALMAMWRIGKLFPRKDRSPTLIPHSANGLAGALRAQGVKGRLRDITRVTSGFYISNLFKFEAGR